MDVRLSKLSRTRGMNGRISASRFAAVVVGAVWVLTALGNNWAEFGLPSFVTANRTAYFILFSSIIILAMVGREKNVRHRLGASSSFDIVSSGRNVGHGLSDVVSPPGVVTP